MQARPPGAVRLRWFGGDRHFASARLSLVAIIILLTGTVITLLSNWARLGTQGQSWGLLQNCPICVAAARLIGPIAEVDTASRVAGIMVWLAFVLGLVGLAYFAQTQHTSTFETFLVASGGFVLAFAPVVFVILLPEAVPIHLDTGGYIALFFGVVSMVTATAGLRAETEEEMVFQSELAKEEAEELEMSRGSSRASGTAGYGAVQPTN